MKTITCEGYLFETDSKEIKALREKCKMKKRNKKRSVKSDLLMLANIIVWALVAIVSFKFPTLTIGMIMAGLAVTLLISEG